MIVRYANNERCLSVDLVYSWARGDVVDSVMTKSSASKPYVRNEVRAVFTRDGNEHLRRVIMVRGGGSPFYLLEDDAGCWSDITRRSVAIELGSEKIDSNLKPVANAAKAAKAAKVRQMELW
jgi:hypothetical protein